MRAASMIAKYRKIVARDYLKRIETLCGVPIDMISTGPDRDETIVCRHPFDG